MVRSSLLILTLLAFWTTSVTAQEHITPATRSEAAPQDGKDHVRAMSGALKDMLGQVQEQMANGSKLASVAKPGQKAELDKTQEALKTAYTEIEASLNEVNRVGPEGWNDAKARAETALAKAKEAIAASRKASSTAVN